MDGARRQLIWLNAWFYISHAIHDREAKVESERVLACNQIVDAF